MGEHGPAERADLAERSGRDPGAAEADGMTADAGEKIDGNERRA